MNNFDYIENLSKEDLLLIYDELSGFNRISECTCALDGGCYNTGNYSFCKIQNGACDYSYCSYLCSYKCDSDVTKCDDVSNSGYYYGWGCINRNGNRVWI